jgi:hypothetical protein
MISRFKPRHSGHDLRDRLEEGELIVWSQRHFEKIGSQWRDLLIKTISAFREMKPVDQHVDNRPFPNHAHAETCVVFLSVSCLTHKRHDALNAIRPFRDKPLLEQIVQFVRQAQHGIVRVSSASFGGPLP